MAGKKDKKDKFEDGVKYIAEEILKAKGIDYNEWVEDKCIELIQSNKETVEKLIKKTKEEFNE